MWCLSCVVNLHDVFTSLRMLMLLKAGATFAMLLTDGGNLSIGTVARVFRSENSQQGRYTTYSR